MIKNDLTTVVLTSPTASEPDLGSARRLIIPVPSLEADLTVVTRRVWELANATGAHVQFIGLYSDAMQEPGLRRELVTMSAIANYGKVSAEIEIIFGRDWVEAIKSHWQAGDMVVCFEEQRVGLSHKPLSQILQSDLNVPLYILSGLYPKSDPSPNSLARAAAWLGSIAIVLIFFVLQVRIGQFAQDWTTALQLLSILGEAWLIWAWNSIFG